MLANALAISDASLGSLLKTLGKKKAPFYRIVAIDSRSKRDGAFLENLGTYNPLTGEFVQFHADRIQEWVAKGAVVTDSVKKLQRKYKAAPKEA